MLPFPYSHYRSSKKLYSEILLCKNSEEPRMVSNIQIHEPDFEDQLSTSSVPVEPLDINGNVDAIEPLDINGNVDEFDIFDDKDDEEYPVVRSVINQVLREKECATCLIKVEEHNAHDLYDCVDELLKNLAEKDARIRELEIQNMELESKLEKFHGDLVLGLKH